MLAIVCMAASGFPVQAQIAFARSTSEYYSNQQTGRVNLKARNEKLQAVLAQVEKQVPFVFVYSPDDININQKVSLEAKNSELSEVLETIARQIGAAFEIINDKIILRSKTSNGGLRNNLTGSSAVQDITITGTVVDENGRPVNKASVYIKGTNIGTTTDASGQFSLSIPDDRANGILIISYVGYAEKEVPLNGGRNFSVALQPSDRSLEDVVVVGYGTQRRTSVTGAVDRVDSRAIEGRPVVNLSQALQGVSPNLIIQQRNFEPGQPVNLNIRGLGTLGDNTPLVVIDGIVGGDINLLNPNDIESVSILKDAGSAAIYGSRSANGVILVTTKKGRKNAKPTVSYNGILGIQSPRLTYEPVSAWENAYYKNESLVNAGQSPVFTPSDIQRLQQRGDGDWQLKNIMQNALQQSHNISLSGGSANNTYLLSAGYINQQSNFIGPDYGYQRYNFRFNQTTDIGKFRLSSVLSYAKVMNKDHSYSSQNLIVDASRVPLYYSFQDSAGGYLTNAVSQELNPKAVLENGGSRRSNDDEVFGNVSGELNLFKGFKLRGVAGGTSRSNNLFSRARQLRFFPGGGYALDRPIGNETFKSLLTNIQLLAEYNRSLGSHNLRILAGGTNESYKEERSALYQQFTDSALGVPNSDTKIDANRSFNTNGTTPWGAPATVETSINSLIGRAGYDYKNKYFAEFSFRYDGSSVFAKDNRWGFFPSAAVAWRITEEAFMAPVKSVVSELKLRASYGLLGNQNVIAYQYQTAFVNSPNGYSFNGASVVAANYRLGNPDLTWEKAATANIGFDAALFGSRLQFSFDYFNKTTSDILYRRQDIPTLFGLSQDRLPSYNVAKVRNRGWEIKANYTMNSGEFRQTVGLNLA
ncbi:MAG TPA: SusC/RagA family TonB-linked outer membrane protein, partial [Flavisolibacter sp.]|nr:SusC/RagA family TonB-linked outer membrane protein [Flavisolibacter sp.]